MDGEEQKSRCNVKAEDHEIHRLLPVAGCQNQDGVLSNPNGKSIVRICLRP